MSLQVFSTNFVRRVCIYIYIYKILRRIQQDIIINVRRSSCKVPLILVRFQWNLNFYGRLSKNTQISNIMEIRPMGAESGGRTDRHGVVPFHSFANAPDSYEEWL